MKKLLLIFCLLYCYFATLFAQATFYKVHLNNERSSQVFKVLALQDGSYATIGITETESGSFQVALSKFDCKGDVEWAKYLGISSTIGNTNAALLQADNGDLLFANNIGSFQNYDILVGRISITGDLIWKNIYGDNRDDICNDMALTNDGDLILVGATNSWGTDASGSLSYRDCYLMKLSSADGSVYWSKTLGNQGAIEGAYAITIDNSNQIFVCGRYLVGGTFYSSILKADIDGNVLLFKGYGAPNHRTYGFGITLTEAGEITITGSTTLDKIDHQSYPDVFLIKTDAQGIPIFSHIFYPLTGSDNSDIGSSVVLQENGGFGIGVSTNSFTNYTQGFVGNKTVIFSTDVNGMLEKTILYNQGSSHYTHLSKALNQGYIISAFSNFFSIAQEFLPVLIKTDQNYSGTCNEINATSEVLLNASADWDVQDISFTESSGHEVVSYDFIQDFSYDNVNTQCETILSIEALFSVLPNDTEPLATFNFFNESGLEGLYLWDFGDGNSSTEQNPIHSYAVIGDYEVCFSLWANCTENTTCATLSIDQLPTTTEDIAQGYLKVSPNPVKDMLFLEWEEKSPVNKIELYNTQGQIVLSKANLPNARSTQIDVSILPAGVYYVNVMLQNSSVGKQIVKL